MSTNTKLAEAARLLDDTIKDLPDGCEGWLEPLDERIAELRAALAAHDAEQAAKSVPADLRSAAERTRQDLGPTGSNYPDVRVLLAFVEQALAAPTPQPAQAERVGLTDEQLSALLKEARKIIRASSSRSLAKDWDRRATQALAGATTGEQR